MGAREVGNDAKCGLSVSIEVIGAEEKLHAKGGRMPSRDGRMPASVNALDTPIASLVDDCERQNAC
jgi:hypothetical protein